MSSGEHSKWSGTAWWSAVVLATAALFHRVVFLGEVLIERDLLRVYVPIQAFWSEQVRQGRFPGWFPYDGFGQPLAGNVVAGPFHPYHLLALPFEPATALTWLMVLCIPLAFGGAWKLLQRLGLGRSAAGVGAIIYGFSGYAVSLTNNLPYLLALATAPWALAVGHEACSTRNLRSLSVSALLLALVLLAGDPMAYLVTAAVLLVLALTLPSSGARLGQRLIVALAVIALSALLSAIQLTCSMAMSQESIASGRTPREAQTWSVAPDRILDILLGRVWSLQGQGMNSEVGALLELGTDSFWADSLYLGLPALVLAALGATRVRRSPLARIALVLTGLGALLMLGQHTPVYGWLYQLVPPWRLLRYPEKLTPHVTVWLAVLTACGIALIEQWGATQRRKLATAFAILAVGMVALASRSDAWLDHYLATLHTGSPIPPETQRLVGAQLSAGALRAALACGGFAAALFVPVPARIQVFLIAGLLGADLLVAGSSVVGTASPELARLEPALVTALREHEQGVTLGRTRVYSELHALQVPALGETPTAERSAATAAALQPVTPSLWGIEAAGAYLQGANPRIYKLLGDSELRWSRGLGLGNVGYAVVAAQRGANNPTRVAAHEPFGLVLLRNPTVLPRVRVSAPRCVASVDEALQRVRSPEFQPGAEAAVECGATSLEQPPQVEGSARLLLYEPTEVQVEVQSKQPALLVLADSYYSGWRATVDGAPAQVLPTDVAFRGVPVPAGAHLVRFTYHTPGLPIGMGLSLLGMGTCLALWGASAHRERAERRNLRSAHPPDPDRCRTP